MRLGFFGALRRAFRPLLCKLLLILLLVTASRVQIEHRFVQLIEKRQAHGACVDCPQKERCARVVVDTTCTSWKLTSRS